MMTWYFYANYIQLICIYKKAINKNSDIWNETRHAFSENPIWDAINLIGFDMNTFFH